MARELIFAPLGGGAGDRDALAAACGLAEALDAEVEATFLGVDAAGVLMIAGDGLSGLGVTAVEALREERARALAAAREAAGACGLSCDDYRGPRALATAKARLAALVVMDPEAARGQGPLADVFEALLFEDGAPVLLPRGPQPYRSIAVAWDGSREAARALKAAGPLFATAEQVRLVQAPEAVEAKDEGAADPDGARSWLLRRNPKLVIETVEFEGDPVRGLLPAAKRGGGVDLIVAGAFGHARLREAMFGGVTRSLLTADSPSLLLAH